MKFSQKNIENWRSWKITFFLGGHFEIFFTTVVQKCQIFVNSYKVENVNVGDKVVKKSQKLVNVICERPQSNL